MVNNNDRSIVLVPYRETSKVSEGLFLNFGPSVRSLDPPCRVRCIIFWWLDPTLAVSRELPFQRDVVVRNCLGAGAMLAVGHFKTDDDVNRERSQEGRESSTISLDMSVCHTFRSGTARTEYSVVVAFASSCHGTATTRLLIQSHQTQTRFLTSKHGKEHIA
eukprot:scaffold4552_cov161-Amphora_coffeaeformis.AAC.3